MWHKCSPELKDDVITCQRSNVKFTINTVHTICINMTLQKFLEVLSSDLIQMSTWTAELIVVVRGQGHCDLRSVQFLGISLPLASCGNILEYNNLIAVSLVLVYSKFIILKAIKHTVLAALCTSLCLLRGFQQIREMSSKIMPTEASLRGQTGPANLSLQWWIPYSS